jgi:hypothetical protein
MLEQQSLLSQGLAEDVNRAERMSQAMSHSPTHRLSVLMAVRMAGMMAAPMMGGVGEKRMSVFQS